jgi:thioredoxin 1
MIHRLLLLTASFVLGTMLTVGCEDGTMPKSETSPNSKETSSNPGASNTTEITTSNFETVVLKSEQPVLVDFWAEWCGPCKAIAPMVEELARKYDGQLVVGKVNVDEQGALAARYNINSIPALLYFKDGEIVKETVGSQSLESLQNQVDEVLGL